MNINPDTAKDTLCKNILIYGYCKYENRGCAFNHNKPSSSVPTSQGSNTTTSNASNSNTVSNNSIGNSESRKKFNLSTPSFRPSSMQGATGKFSSASPKLKDIPAFIPSGGINGSDGSASVYESMGNDTMGSTKKFNASTPSFTPSNQYMHASEPLSASHMVQPPMSKAPLNGQTNVYLPGAIGSTQSTPSIPQAPSSADLFYQQPSTSYPLQYYLYAPAPPPRLTMPLPPHETNASSMFIPNDLRETLQKKNEATLQTLPRSTLPQSVGIFHSLVPIDSTFGNVSKVYGVPSAVFKVFSNVDGNPYILRKIDNHSLIRIANELPFRTIKKWKSVKSANVVQLQDAFTSAAFGGSSTSLMVAYDYFPNSNTLTEQHVSRKLGSKLELITEELLWCYMIEISNALTAIHEKGLAARSSLDLTKIIVTNKNRIRLSGVAISDILNYEKDEAEIRQKSLAVMISEWQQQDIVKFGEIILDLAALTLPVGLRSGDKQTVITNLQNSSTVQFSDEFIVSLRALVTATNDLHAFVKEHLSLKLLSFANNLEDSSDFMESQLSTELENARLVRLCAKLNFIIDRPEFENDPEWQQNGPKHIIKLFRDYIFFQYDEFGNPVCDLSRVLTNLNKLDAAIDEQFLLVTRDERNCIIVSYKEIRDIIDSVFRSLTSR
ncbi:Piso0_003747 [Millerozyma farinosa CBS 7064]|uniref:PAN2-PAN3 deadenylation complex subunit PAN3 n=1 Tax=Pichia sorbitophila (strain ATCC MYA-4447 / BCRC 22081 / CBS 7064 / NBRC 10061 / NRRL Y-12695) TaxID=559304 RepID=G8Y6H6_PICSO|nr:Piso0_003747 [Millerozyma farinosa CBS 7064]CCE84206.1 Piso0_003747 [Millerozyma farinosa CBS 7064]